MSTSLWASLPFIFIHLLPKRKEWVLKDEATRHVFLTCIYSGSQTLRPSLCCKGAQKKIIERNFGIISAFVMGRFKSVAAFNTTHCSQRSVSAGAARFACGYLHTQAQTSLHNAVRDPKSQFCAPEGWIMLIPRNEGHISRQNNFGYKKGTSYFTIT